MVILLTHNLGAAHSTPVNSSIWNENHRKWTGLNQIYTNCHKALSGLLTKSSTWILTGYGEMGLNWQWQLFASTSSWKIQLPLLWCESKYSLMTLHYTFDSTLGTFLWWSKFVRRAAINFYNKGHFCLLKFFATAFIKSKLCIRLWVRCLSRNIEESWCKNLIVVVIVVVVASERRRLLECTVEMLR